MFSSTSNQDWVKVTSDAPTYYAFNKPVEKSQRDDRDYRIIRLENGLHATLVHDSKADKAAASLDVAVGHLYDPDDMPGLAHFCEHLLFMGTEQYPKENEYSEFLAKNNGSSNAFTSTSNTNYYFNVSTNALTPALSRFAAFFHCPLFSPSCTSRELNAVDSEHKKNHQADPWRIFQLNKHLTRPGHVWSKFGSGNRESLSKAARVLKAQGKLKDTTSSSEASEPASLAPSPVPSRIPTPSPTTSESEADGGVIGREVRRRLVEWWSKEYCANRMRLCIIGKESLDDLSALVATLFSPIPNRSKDALPMIHEHPFGPAEMGTLVSVDTIMRFHAVEISFPLEYQPPLWRHKPSDLLSHFLGHEGPGSLHSYLKKKGWITALSSGSQNLARGFAMFKATIHLTNDGFDNHREVILATFKYLSLLRSSELSDYHQHEAHQMSSIQFRFQEKRRPDDYATWIAEHMAWPVPPELLLSGPQVTWDWNSEEDKRIGAAKVHELLQGMTVDRARAVLMAKADEHERIAGTSLKWETEPIYGTRYCVSRFEDEFLQKARSPNDVSELFLPTRNEFIPDNFEVNKRDTDEHLKRPHLIRETELSSLWHKKDDRFWVPKATVTIEIRSPVANENPLAAVLTRLYSDLVKDSLTEYSYNAELAGLSYNFIPHTTGLYITLAGYNDKLINLAKYVFERIKQLSVDEQRLVVMKEQCKRDWENFFLSQSYQLSDYFARYLLTHQQWTVDEKLAQLSSVTPADVQKHIENMLLQTHTRILVNGNMSKNDAIHLAEMAEIGLSVSKTPASQLDDLSLILPPASNYTWTSVVPNPNQPNSALSYYMYIGATSDQHLRVTASLLAQILTEPAFNVLRTKEQLGYIVSCSQWNQAGSTHKGIRIVVQSEKPPSYLEDRVENFLSGMKTIIMTMSEDEFQEQKNGLEKKWREGDKNLSEESNRFWTHIGTGLNDFLRRNEDADFLHTVTKEDVLSLFASHIDPSSTTRRKVSVHLKSRKPRPVKVSPAASQAVKDLMHTKGYILEANSLKEVEDDASGMTITNFKQAWSKYLTHAGATPEQLNATFQEVDELIKAYPGDDESVDAVRPGNKYIEDMKAFRENLEVSSPAKPLVEWGDLPVSRL